MDLSCKPNHGINRSLQSLEEALFLFNYSTRPIIKEAIGSTKINSTKIITIYARKKRSHRNTVMIFLTPWGYFFTSKENKSCLHAFNEDYYKYLLSFFPSLLFASWFFKCDISIASTIGNVLLPNQTFYHFGKHRNIHKYAHAKSYCRVNLGTTSRLALNC